jgi:hypothetical protein
VVRKHALIVGGIFRGGILMDGIFVIEPATQILAVLQAGDEKEETFGMAFQQPNGRVIVKFRHKDRKGRKTVTQVVNEQNMVDPAEAVRVLCCVADRFRGEGINAYCCSPTRNKQLFGHWIKTLQTDQEIERPAPMLAL